MAGNITLDAVQGTYGRGLAQIVVTRDLRTGTATISAGAPSVTLDAEGRKALARLLADVVEVGSQGPNPLQGDGSGSPLPAFSSVPRMARKSK